MCVCVCVFVACGENQSQDGRFCIGFSLAVTAGYSKRMHIYIYIYIYKTVYLCVYLANCALILIKLILLHIVACRLSAICLFTGELAPQNIVITVQRVAA